MKEILDSLLRIFGIPTGASFGDRTPPRTMPRSAQQDAVYENLVADLQLKPIPIDPEEWDNSSLD